MNKKHYPTQLFLTFLKFFNISANFIVNTQQKKQF